MTATQTKNGDQCRGLPKLEREPSSEGYLGMSAKR